MNVRAADLAKCRVVRLAASTLYSTELGSTPGDSFWLTPRIKKEGLQPSAQPALSLQMEELRSVLLNSGQGHLFEGWPVGGDEAQEQRFFAQVNQLESSYPGGVAAYIRNARKLLADSKAGVNPLDGWTPSVPTGEKADFGSPAFLEHEALGLQELDGCAFVLVAGGLGERLGYSGIKLALPTQISTSEPYIALYIRQILALQRHAAAATGRAVVLPLMIMVSDDTAGPTDALLRANGFWGMTPEQVTLLKQEKVACVADNDARLATDPQDPYSLLTKPHGHGDVHYLMHSSGLAARWLAEGRRWVYFLQDTNALAFKVLPACLGVSKALGLHVNSVAVARKAGESIGGLMTLSTAPARSTATRTMTVNVECATISPASHRHGACALHAARPLLPAGTTRSTRC